MASDTASVQYAKNLLESALGRRVVVADQGGPDGDVDLRALDRPTLAIEVKQITNSNLRIAMARRSSDSTWVASNQLRKHWGLACGVDPPPDLKRVRIEIETHLLVMEQHGVSNSRSWDRAGLDLKSSLEVQRAAWAITQLLSGGIAIASEPSDYLPTGFRITIVHGGASPVDPDVFAGQVVGWVMGDNGAKLRWKLEACFDDERHAALVLDRAHPTDLGRSPHHLRGQLPTEPIELPGMVDCLWIAQPDVLAWRYNREAGWTNVTPADRRAKLSLGTVPNRR